MVQCEEEYRCEGKFGVQRSVNGVDSVAMLARASFSPRLKVSVLHRLATVATDYASGIALPHARVDK